MDSELSPADVARQEARLRAGRNAIHTGVALIALQNLRPLLLETIDKRDLSISGCAEQVGVHKSVLFGFLQEGKDLRWSTLVRILYWLQYGKQLTEEE